MMMGVIDPHDVVATGCISGVREENIQPNSVDLTVSKIYTINGTLVLYANKENRRKLPEYTEMKSFLYEGVEMYKLEPGIRYQVEFNEQLKLNDTLCGITLVRSSMAKSGCTGENGLFDSGYEGACGMMVQVQAESYIEVGASIAQMIFLTSETSKTYNGFYQGTNSPMEWR